MEVRAHGSLCHVLVERTRFARQTCGFVRSLPPKECDGVGGCHMGQTISHTTHSGGVHCVSSFQRMRRNPWVMTGRMPLAKQAFVLLG